MLFSKALPKILQGHSIICQDGFEMNFNPETGLIEGINSLGKPEYMNYEYCIKNDVHIEFVYSYDLDFNEMMHTISTNFDMYGIREDGFKLNSPSSQITSNEILKCVNMKWRVCFKEY